MIGATTLTFSNLIQGKTLSLVVTGDEVLTVPTGFDSEDLSGFDGTKTNYIQIYCANSSTPVFTAGLKAR